MSFILAQHIYCADAVTDMSEYCQLCSPPVQATPASMQVLLMPLWLRYTNYQEPIDSDLLNMHHVANAHQWCNWCCIQLFFYTHDVMKHVLLNAL